MSAFNAPRTVSSVLVTIPKIVFGILRRFSPLFFWFLSVFFLQKYLLFSARLMFYFWAVLFFFSIFLLFFLFLGRWGGIVRGGKKMWREKGMKRSIDFAFTGHHFLFIYFLRDQQRQKKFTNIDENILEHTRLGANVNIFFNNLLNF